MIIPNLLDSKCFVKQLDEFSKNSSSKVNSFLNPYSLYILQSRPTILNAVDQWYADGSLLVTAYNHTNNSRIDRVSFDFSSIANTVFEHSEMKSLRVLCVGASTEEARDFHQFLNSKYPSIKLDTISGYFDEEEERYILKYVSDFDIIIIGMGSGLQEELGLHIKRLYPKGKLIFTCGGFISQTARKGDFYHPLVKQLGLRWLQRAYRDKHVRQRLLFIYPKFIFLYIKYILNRSIHGK